LTAAGGVHTVGGNDTGPDAALAGAAVAAGAAANAPTVLDAMAAMVSARHRLTLCMGVSLAVEKDSIGTKRAASTTQRDPGGGTGGGALRGDAISLSTAERDA
jgi:hypothetical protein